MIKKLLRLHSIPKPLRLVFVGILLQCFVAEILQARHILAQSVYDIQIALQVKNKTIKEVFDLIEEKTEFTFSYSSRTVDLSRSITLDGREQNLGKIIEDVANKAQLEFKQLNTIIMLKRKTVNHTEAWGIIKGRTIDEATSEALPGATIIVKGTNSGTTSDLNGEFQLRALEGDIELEISYMGFKKSSQLISVKGGIVTEVECKLANDITQLSAVVVTGVLQGQQRALNQQKSADNIKNVVSADQIGRFPDPNVAEALQRVPAVNIERDQGEGRYVLVRGLAPQFTNISINGEQIPSPEAGVRYVALDAIPADQLSSIEVTKAITPDMDGDAIGGNVNLITRSAQTSTPSIRSSAVLGYNDIVQRTNLQGSLEYSQRFLNNKLGIMLNSSYYESDRGSDNWERDDNDLELRDYELVRTRLGLSSTIDYKFSDRSEVYFRTIYNRFTDREQRRRYVFVPNVDSSSFEVNEIERLTKDRLEKQYVSSFNLGAKHIWNKLNIDYEVSYAEAIQDTPYDNEAAFVGEADGLALDYNTNPHWPSLIVESDPNYLNNSLYEFDEVAFGNTYAFDKNTTAKFNIGIPYSINSTDGLFKFGGKVRFKEKSYDVTENVFSWEGAGDLTLDQFEGGPADDNFLDRYTLRKSVDMDAFIRHFNANQSGYELSVDDKLAAEAVESYTATEDVFAGYAMTKLQFNKLMLLGGLRYEKTKVDYTYSTVVYGFDDELQEIIPERGSTEYAFLLPQLHAKYQVNDKTNIRAAVTRSYSRPNFESIIPSSEVEFSGRAGTLGNPNLKPVGATNIDVLSEHYFGSVGILSGGFFYKKLTDFIFNRNYETTTFPGSNGVALEITQAQNGEDATLSGFEFAYQQNLSFLPGKLKGLSLYTNYTYTHSKATIQGRGEIRLPGQARHVGNAAIGYDIGKFNIRLATNFNGEYILEVGEEPAKDIFVRDRMQLDASATFTISPKIRVFGEFLNITNQPFEVFQGGEERFIQREFYSWWSRVGIKFDLN
ncbi:MAG: TonB-dependent receptor [Flammeovirgaceae bacterium]|nr:TonB-dependent receptor [Flammeovirgaceae bacterium]